MTKYSDLPIPLNACHYRIGTHTVRDAKTGEEVKSRSYCRKLTQKGSEYCPRHAYLMQIKEDDKARKEEEKRQQLLQPSTALNV